MVKKVATTVDPAMGMKEICAASGQGLMSVYAAINAGHLKTYLVGRRRFARASALNAWLDFMQKQSDSGRAVVYRPRVEA